MMDYSDIDYAIRQGVAADLVPSEALALLKDIVAGRRDPAAVRHPLGFLCLPVQRYGAHGVCVHIWVPTLRPEITTSQMHSHSWDLASYVLYGTLRNQRIRLAQTPGVATHRVFEVRSHGDVDELHATDQLVSCEQERPSMHDAGSVYLLPAGEFHATEVPAGQHVATVVLGRSRRSAADLSLGPLGMPSHVVTRSRCDRAETVRAARLLAERLEATGVA